MESSLKKLAFEQIESCIWYAYYGKYVLVIRKSDGYFNFGKLCDEYSKMHPESPDKLWDWLRTDNYIKLSEALDKRNEMVPYWQGVEFDLDVDVNTTADWMCHGTYMHPDMLPHLLSYADPDFALEASSVLHDHMIKQYQKNCTTEEFAEVHKRIKLANSMDQWPTKQAFVVLRINSEPNTYLAIREFRKAIDRLIKHWRTKYPAAIIIFQDHFICKEVSIFHTLLNSNLIKSIPNKRFQFTTHLHEFQLINVIQDIISTAPYYYDSDYVYSNPDYPPHVSSSD
jgi:hypothetical protein